MKTMAFKFALSILFIIGLVFCAHTQDRPLDPTRVLETELSVSYFPSFNFDLGFPFYDKFSFNCSIFNIINTSINLNVYLGYNHAIKDSYIMPETVAEIEAYEVIAQAADTVHGKMRLSFLKFFQFNLGTEFLQNRIVPPGPGYPDYNFNMITSRAELSYDRRKSVFETWYIGRTPIYPTSGFYLSGGINHNYILPAVAGGTYHFFNALGRMNWIIPFHPFLSLSLNVEGESHLKAIAYRPHMLTARAIGSYEIPGDYVVDASVELRFLTPKGLFIGTPSLGFLYSFLLKFSPGILIGYNTALAGQIGENDLHMVHSGYIAPLIAIRLSGSLVTVLRFDFSLSSSNIYQGIFSISMGSMGSKPESLLQAPW